MLNKTERVDNVVALCGIIWLVLSIDACFTWFFPDVLLDVLGFVFVLYGHVILLADKGVIFSRQRRLAIISLMVLALYMIFIRFYVYNIFIYISLMLITLWRESTLLRMYDYFRNFVLFYAILSICVELLVLTGLWLSLPHIILPPHDFVQENLGYVNYFYGFFCIPAEGASLTFYRACGPLREGGHFIFYIGFVYFVEKAIYNKRNIWLIICGLLTLSPNFIILFLIAEGYCAIIQKRFLKPFLGVISIVAGAFVLFLFSPQSIKDEIIRIIFERMLEESIENMDSEGAMAILNGRVGDIGLQTYENFNNSGILTKLRGVPLFEGDEMPSDYRWLLIYCGYIGSGLMLWCCFAYSHVKKDRLFSLCLFLFAFAVFLQRAWMLRHVYILAIMLLITNIKSFSSKNRNSYA